MPALARKLLICAAADALLIHPVGSRDERGRAIRIAYGDNRISTREHQEDEQDDQRAIESFGVVGLLNLVSSSYLISIIKRDEVGHLTGAPVYAIRSVALIPLSSQDAAARAITAVQRKLNITTEQNTDQSELSDIGDEAETLSVGEHSPRTSLEDVAPSGVASLGDGSTGKTIIQSKTPYGKLADRWFRKGRGQSTNSRKRQNQSSEDSTSEAQELKPWLNRDSGDDHAVDDNGETTQQSSTLSGIQRPSVLESLTPRILRSAQMYFSSGGFYFSYDHDLSRTLGNQRSSDEQLPLWKRFHSLYFWNRHLLAPLIDANCDELILPIMQGFVGQRSFTVRASEGKEDTGHNVSESSTTGSNSNSDMSILSQNDGARNFTRDFLLTLISRRSTKRTGLRYLRRGVDEHGNVANDVETEQILSPADPQSGLKSHSLVQVRGSIPLFFSQSPYSFKPLPVAYGSEATNQDAFIKHLTSLRERYGNIQVASLVDKHGTEVGIGESYEKHLGQFNESKSNKDGAIGFEWFDFHSVCKGMKFEKVSILLESLQQPLQSFGWTVKRGNEMLQKQTGVLRTNCMDCLDRTNVVQSAVAGSALQQQLSALGFSIDLQHDAKTQWFNALWADNGDAISKQYAGTAALKGDFTRTRKRNWTGALSDFSLTLTRYYNNIFGDYFLQTEIDFFLGNTGPEIFEEFEADLKSKDYALDMRRIRQQAIDTCEKIVLEDPKETVISGWTLSCPSKANTLRSPHFEECVLLLTKNALYFCRFDWGTERVSSFERIELVDVHQIWRGPYITSVFGPTHLDEIKNVGFALRYTAGPQAIVRRNTRSLQNKEGAADENAGKNELDKQQEPEKDGSRLLAFKALPPKESAMKSAGGKSADLSEAGMVKAISDDIHAAMEAAARNSIPTSVGEPGKTPEIEERAIVSAADARKSTGYAESIGYSLKRLVWS